MYSAQSQLPLLANSTLTGVGSDAIVDFANVQDWYINNNEVVTISKLQFIHANPKQYVSTSFNGGAIRIGNATVTIDGCTFRDSYVNSRGGGIYRNGGSGTVTVSNSLFTNMYSAVQLNMCHASTILDHVIITGLTTNSSINGIPIFNESSDLTLIGCTVFGNTYNQTDIMTYSGTTTINGGKYGIIRTRQDASAAGNYVLSGDISLVSLSAAKTVTIASGTTIHFLSNGSYITGDIVVQGSGCTIQRGGGSTYQVTAGNYTRFDDNGAT